MYLKRREIGGHFLPSERSCFTPFEYEVTPPGSFHVYSFAFWICMAFTESIKSWPIYNIGAKKEVSFYYLFYSVPALNKNSYWRIPNEWILPHFINMNMKNNSTYFDCLYLMLPCMCLSCLLSLMCRLEACWEQGHTGCINKKLYVH